MKKLSPILVVVLALLMQLRVAYACDAAWLADCQLHGVVAEVALDDEPSDRGDRCAVGVDLAVRAGRVGGDVLAAEFTPPTSSDFIALVPAALAIPSPLSDRAASPRPPRTGPARGAGTRTWLSTARLRL
ncbi:hypothetical protein [Nevskia sp.]|uniref:hypothetical protein n=1 Tax=Nevskia sp. TaxID=1929292 RepID=UPI003F6F08C9